MPYLSYEFTRNYKSHEMPFPYNSNISNNIYKLNSIFDFKVSNTDFFEIDNESMEISILSTLIKNSTIK